MAESQWTKWGTIAALLGVPIAIAAIVVPILVNHDSTPAAPPATPATTAANPTGGTPATTRAAAPAGAKVLGTYQDIELTNFYAVDLDADPPKVGQFQTLEFLIPGATGVLVTAAYQLALLPPGTPASYAQCHTATRYTYQISADQLENGSQICVTTTHHRLARLTVTHAPTPEDNPPYIAFDATIWQTPLT